MSPKEILTKELLEEEYVKNKLGTLTIARKYGIKSKNSVEQAIKRFELHRDSLRDISSGLTKDWLYQKYVIEDLSAIDIARLLGIKRKASILAKLHEFEIPIRQTNKTKKYTSFNNRRKLYYEQIRVDYWNSLKYGARSRNYEFSIDIKYAWNLFLKQNKKCALSGMELFFCDSRIDKKSSQTASLDRIDSSKGYIVGNVQWVHKKVNKMKQNLDQSEFIEFCRLISDKSRGIV